MVSILGAGTETYVPIHVRARIGLIATRGDELIDIAMLRAELSVQVEERERQAVREDSTDGTLASTTGTDQANHRISMHGLAPRFGRDLAPRGGVAWNRLSRVTGFSYSTSSNVPVRTSPLRT
jgi:hypothetical protein